MLKTLTFVLAISVFALASFCAVAFVFITHDLPQIDSIQDYKPPVSSRVYDSAGHVIGEFFVERRTLLTIEEIPPHVKNAFLAAEDADFYTHGGVDPIGIFRAVLNEIRYRLVGGQRVGGSTITQQTAKTMLLSRKQTYTRKIKEIILAKRIEERLSKDEILNLYLNQIYFGNGAYGIEEAARTYWGISARALSLGQAAALASIPKSPNRINPLRDPERMAQRRDYVLEQMVVHGFCNRAQANAARREDVSAKPTPNPYLNIAPYFTEEIRRQLVQQFGEETVLYKGLNIYTSLDSQLQKNANYALREGLRAVDKRQGWRGPLLRANASLRTRLREVLDAKRNAIFAKGKNTDLVWNLQHLNAELLEGSSQQAIDAISLESREIGRFAGGLVKSIDDEQKIAWIDLGSSVAALPMDKMAWARKFNPDSATKRPSVPSDVLSVGDIVLVRIDAVQPRLSVLLEQDPQVNGAFSALDAESGAVVALVGGYDFAKSSFNRATQAKRQPGSSFKPFIYGTAIDKQAVTAATLITDAPKVFFQGNDENTWKPKNHTGKFLGDITVRTCLTRSVNTCSITLLELIGIDAVRQTAAQVGLMTDKTPFPRDLTLALGTGEVVPLDHFNAFRVFPNLGRYSPYTLFNRVVTQRGEVLFESKPEVSQVFRPQSAFIITNILRGLVSNARNTTGLDAPLAGKTGTTNQMRSAWFVGYSQDLVAGVYVGFDDNRSLGTNEYGFKAALPIWAQFMRATLKTHPAREFEVPSDLVWRYIDQSTGLLANSGASQSAEGNEDESVGDAPTQKGVVWEAFIPGTQPTLSQQAAPTPLELFDSGGTAP